MAYFDYADVKGFLGDAELVRLLCADRTYPQLLDAFMQEDFLAIDAGMKVPFFAEVRDYVGAVEKADPKAHWIVKPIGEEDTRGPAMGAICFFLDFFTRTISAPTIVTRINGVVYKATRVITKTEQLTGANYTDIPQLKEQLVLDLVNRWIYCDEDRNPNNYLIRYNSRNDPIIIAIDFSNVDLLHPGPKITGNPKSFGWERSEKTRYLTPLKVEHFLGYDMRFFDMRFDGFRRVGKKMLLELCKGCLRFLPDRTTLAKTVADNLLERIVYVHEYFRGKFPRETAAEKEDKYSDMGKTFTNIYKEKR
ncbi:MAG: hypothetical protein ABSF77_08065 [Spirochaetia bacterium]|jgi:hypothetical protein